MSFIYNNENYKLLNTSDTRELQGCKLWFYLMKYFAKNIKTKSIIHNHQWNIYQIKYTDNEYIKIYLPKTNNRTCKYESHSF